MKDELQAGGVGFELELARFLGEDDAVLVQNLPFVVADRLDDVPI